MLRALVLRARALLARAQALRVLLARALRALLLAVAPPLELALLLGQAALLARAVLPAPRNPAPSG